MTHRYTPALAIALLVKGLFTGGIGLLSGNDALWQVGLFFLLSAVPLLIIRTVHTSQRATADQLDAADRAGYARALDHVARGLLDAPTPPHGGNRNHRAEQAAGNVITLRPHHIGQPERKAQ
ncbi:hypothetical protein C9F11_20020 [Streptomyces sp. YIM 121038]|uniref:hypothetical protein n=1 Tax=Streptomyces sp. YIM 121038 TaxID=2136401 RepID=UPI00111082DE|nr:hypothetical protein [Streptomyces sp. YIM 121038]QCX77639.1 hypothetical protein C9F11_20020 [Streptomyces sp. YIM 121038]